MNISVLGYEVSFKNESNGLSAGGAVALAKQGWIIQKRQ